MAGKVSARRRVAIVVIVLGLIAWDLSRPPRRQWTARAMLTGIDLYQAVVSPVVGAVGARCRFRPTCSHYAEAAISEQGAWVGGGRALWRIARCGPWTEPGTEDPP
jgi:putative membrane protein insertion efficiency factor